MKKTTARGSRALTCGTIHTECVSLFVTKWHKHIDVMTGKLFRETSRLIMHAGCTGGQVVWDKLSAGCRLEWTARPAKSTRTTSTGLGEISDRKLIQTSLSHCNSHTNTYCTYLFWENQNSDYEKIKQKLTHMMIESAWLPPGLRAIATLTGLYMVKSHRPKMDI